MTHKPKYGYTAQMLANACQALRSIEGAKVSLTFDAVVHIHRNLSDEEDDLFQWCDDGNGSHSVFLKHIPAPKS
jgi:hypothetical protein